MTEEKNLLKAIKAAGLTHAEVLELLTEQGILNSESITVEEEEIAKQKAKEEAEKKKLEESEEEEDEEEEEEEEKEETPGKEDLILEEIKKLKKEVKTLRTKGIPLKTPSAGTKTDKDKLPDEVNPSIKKNKFEAMI